MDMRRLFTILIVTGVLSGSPAAAEDVSPAAIRQAIEGTWALEEWNIDGSRVLPPEASGRLSLHDNVIMITYAGTYFGQTRSVHGYGNYAVDGASWSYGYEAYTFMKETTSNVSVSNELPWNGLRRFSATADGDKLILRYDAANAQIVISGDDFQYIESGTLVRRWKRISP